MTMTNAEPSRSSDEQVYQENRDELEVRTVYSTEAGEMPTDAQVPDQSIPTKEDVDEISAESFPASDAPPNTPPAAPDKD
jgi:hypothetical protein